jgi:hypothetical protein
VLLKVLRDAIAALAPKELDVLEVSIDELATAVIMRSVARSRP